jgi:hypothetical protein
MIRALLLSAACLATFGAMTLAADVSLVARDPITNYFGEQHGKWQFELIADEDAEAIVQWRILAAGRTIVSRDDAPLPLEAGKPRIIELEHQLPPVKEGVIFPLELHVSVTKAGGKEPAAEVRQPLYLFPPDPFMDQKEWLKSLNLQVFDPEDTTADALTELEVPYTRIMNLAVLEDLPSGILIVGQGIAFEDHGPLGDALLAAAVRGVSVLCLAPKSARINLPVAGNPDSHATGMTLRRRDIIQTLDKRFSSSWLPGQDVVARGLSFEVDKDEILATAVAADQGWSWVEVEYERPADAPKNSPPPRFIYCGLDLLGSWKESPTPRFLFARLLSTLSPANDKTSTTP